MTISKHIRLAAILGALALTFSFATAQEGWAGYTQTGHYTTNNPDGTTVDHDSGKNADGDKISTETTRDPDGRATQERTEVRDKNGKLKYIRITKWENRDKPWEITWGYLWDYVNDGSDFQWDPKKGEWMREPKRVFERPEPNPEPKKDPKVAKTMLPTLDSTLNGTVIVEDKTKFGGVKVILPNDLAAGDIISGTVIPDPKGKTDAEKQQNASKLEEMVVEINGQKTTAADGLGKWLIPAGASFVAIRLLDNEGHELTRRTIQVNAPPSTPPSEFNAPQIGQAGRPVTISGPFDGDSSNTKATIGGTQAEILAESPRHMVVMSPSNMLGMSTLELRAGNKTFSSPFRAISIGLAMDSRTLVKGQRTQLTLRVAGLEGLTEPVPIHVSTQSGSGAARMVGGNEQEIMFQPGDVTDGACTKTLQLDGAEAGKFTVEASLSTQRLSSGELSQLLAQIRGAEEAERQAAAAKGTPNEKKAQDAADRADTETAAAMMDLTASERAGLYRRIAQEHRDRAKRFRGLPWTDDKDHAANLAAAAAEEARAAEADSKANAQHG